MINEITTKDENPCIYFCLSSESTAENIMTIDRMCEDSGVFKDRAKLLWNQFCLDYIGNFDNFVLILNPNPLVSRKDIRKAKNVTLVGETDEWYTFRINLFKQTVWFIVTKTDENIVDQTINKFYGRVLDYIDVIQIKQSYVSEFYQWFPRDEV